MLGGEKWARDALEANDWLKHAMAHQTAAKVNPRTFLDVYLLECRLLIVLFDSTLVSSSLPPSCHVSRAYTSSLLLTVSLPCFSCLHFLTLTHCLAASLLLTVSLPRSDSLSHCLALADCLTASLWLTVSLPRSG